MEVIMRSQVLFSSGCSRWTMTGIAALVFLVVTPAHAQVGNLVVTVVVVKNYPMDGGDAIRTRNAALAREGQWKVKGAQFEEKTVGKAICAMLAVPQCPHIRCAPSLAATDTLRSR